VEPRFALTPLGGVLHGLHLAFHARESAVLSRGRGRLSPAESGTSRRRFLAGEGDGGRNERDIQTACVLANPEWLSLRVRRPHSRGHRPRTSFAVSRAIREARSSPAAGAVAAA